MCFDDHILLYSHALMFIYSTFTCPGDHMLLYLQALTITCPHACMPSCSYVWTVWWSHAHIMYALILTCSYILGFSHVYMLWLSYSLMLTCLDDHMLICFDEQMLPRSMPWSPWSSHAYMLRWLHSPMLTFININMFDICMHVHIVRWWYVYIYL